MVQRSSSPASPVTITITSSNKASGVTHRRSTGPSSPAPGRPFSTSNTTTSPTPSRISSGGGRRYSTAEETESTEFVRYTVQIPATPEHHHSSAPPEPAPVSGKSYISGTLFTGGFNCVTRGHVLCSSGENPADPGQCKMLCQMKGCDGDPFYTKSKQNPCECGYLICKDCYFDCLVNGGKCPGCKEIYREKGEEDCGFDAEEEVLPLTSIADFGYGRRLSMMKSVKGPADFDHSRWLFETKGTYGYGNAVWPKDGCRDGGGGARGGGGGFKGFEEPPNFSCNSKRPLTRKISVSQAIISPYRLLIVLRLVALGFFLSWRIRHPNPDAIWLWAMSIACELWFAVSWLLDQLPKLCPVNRATDLSVLKERFESPSLRNPKGRSDLPGIDVFVSTADPEKEPPLATANTVLSILAVDYPVEKLACYLSDDGGSLLTFEALAETASFAKNWVPFCRKHEIEPRNPEAYFSQTKDFIKNKVRLDFVRERRRVKREYDEFRVRINSLPESIRRRSDAFNAHEDLRAKKKHDEFAGALPEHVPKATWMSDGSHWPGTWSSGETEHSRGDHAGIIQAMLAPPNSEPELGNEEGNTGLLINTSTVDIRLPMLVYVSREKRPSYDHNKKAGAMNALVRTSAIMSNGPFILNLDCDHYIHNSQSLREGMCFMLDSGGDRVCFVQFPQRFEGIDPNDRYANHNLVFFDVTMRAMDGLQGPMYVGTGCIFRRTALYGFSPPRATERRGWLGKNKKKIKPTMWNTKKTDNNNTNNSNNEEQEVDEDDVESCSLLPKMFGNSSILSSSIPIAEFQGRLLQDLPGNHPGRPAGSLAVPREPLDASAVAEAISVISSHYEAKTEWGKRVGWIYGSVTEDVVTGYRMHNRGWRSIYCVTKRDAFRGTAPINLTDRLHQVLRWATGSVEIFFSRNNALFATNRMKVLQRIAYFNAGMYPFTSIFLLIYCVLPAVSLFSGKFIVQSFSVSFLVFLLVITITLCLLALLEIKWSGITLHDWWRNEQFWVIGGTSAHPAAVVQGLLKVIAGVEISFTLTSKPGGGDEDAEEFAEMYVVRWSLLMVTPVTIMMVNIIAMAVAFGRTMYSEAPRWSEMVGGLFFSLWVLCHLYPFGKGLLGRKGKVPTIVFVWAGLISIVVSLLWVYVSPPQGARNNDYMSF